MATKKETKRFNKALLDEVVKRDKCVLVGTYDDKLNRDTIINFTCVNIECGEQSSKTFRMLHDYGAFCKACTVKNGVVKAQATNMKNHGVASTFQVEGFKEKARKTCKEKFGHEHAMQNAAVRKKAEATTLERHGVPNASQSEYVKQKKMDTCIKNHGVAYPTQSEDVKAKIIETNLINHGVEHTFQREDVKAKIIENNLERHGVMYNSQREDIKAKIMQTNLINHGVEHTLQREDVKAKIIETNLERHGVMYNSQREDVKAKIVDTFMKNHGVPHPMQNPEVLERQMKSSFSHKEFTFPCGKTVSVQGYEPFALDNLVKEGFTSSDILLGASEVPEIWYLKNEKSHRYFCDIYIPKINKMIEVKSSWTIQLLTGNIDEKAIASKQAGYLYEIWVFDGKGNKEIRTY